MSQHALVQYNDSTDVMATTLRLDWLTSADAGFYLWLPVEDDLKTMRFDSLTLLFELDKSLLEKPDKNLSSSFGLNISNSESLLTGDRTPLSAGSNPEG